MDHINDAESGIIYYNIYYYFYFTFIVKNLHTSNAIIYFGNKINHMRKHPSLLENKN
jgi:ABC-type uncharacterized transport system permease subunit